ncbi:transporter [Defluviimonas sp. D31]|uniref:SphA family protein n=1 Tax=Defluviimonas sp. D31 TaxID=3083253 RepID=UPI00296E63F7|nr:transporter [Defluviimonas sp. D31]MDW4551283.1 transporter [Defluviimonas sp. D31]
MKSTRFSWLAGTAALALGAAFSAPAAFAVEGGTGAYFLGSRDTLAGVVPPPGNYVSSDFIYFEGSVENVSIGGLAVGSAKVRTNLFKFSYTHVFDASLWGGTPAINLNIPYANADIDLTTPAVAGSLQDERTAMGDISVTGMVGWHDGMRHWNTGATVYAPVGQYDPATINPATRQADVLSIGKNVWAIQPFIAGTYLNTENGRELSGAASLLFSEPNDATDYHSAPQFALELAALQHLPSGLALGASGYAYHQIGDDGGVGAERIRQALGASSLRAQVYGIGPIVTYSGEFSGQKATMEFHYTHEFDAKRRFESDVYWMNVGFVF